MRHFSRLWRTGSASTRGVGVASVSGLDRQAAGHRLNRGTHLRIGNPPPRAREVAAVEQSDLAGEPTGLRHTGSGNCYRAAVLFDKTERNSNDDKA